MTTRDTDSSLANWNGDVRQGFGFALGALIAVVIVVCVLMLVLILFGLAAG